MRRTIADEIRDELPELDVEPVVKQALETWLATDREFNSWFLVTTKRQLRDDELTALLDGYRESQEVMERGWAQFREEGHGAQIEASAAISIAQMHELMKR